MTTNEPKNNMLIFAIENDMPRLALWYFEQDNKTENLNEMIKLAIEKNVSKELMDILISRLEVQPPNELKKTVYPIPLKIHESINLKMSDKCFNSDKNSTLMVQLHLNSKEVYDDLQMGKYSLEEINYQNSRGWTILHYLARNANNIPFSLEIVSYLLSNTGINVNLQNSSATNSYTPLMLAAMHSDNTSNPEMFKLLLSHPNNDFNLKYRGKDSILDSVINHMESSRVETIKLIVEHPKFEDVFLNNKDSADIIINMIKNNVEPSIIIDLIKSKKIKLNLKENIKKYSSQAGLFLEMIKLFTEHWIEGLLA